MQKPIRAVVVDATAKTVTETTVASLEDMQRIVGGLIEVAHEFPNGDTLFVNEEGPCGDPVDFIEVRGAHQPFAGNAFIIGAVDDDGDSLPARSTVEEIRKAVAFVHIEELRARIVMEDLAREIGVPA